MPAQTSAAPKLQAAIERRNQELLEFQNAAFLLALRICGNVPDAEDILQDAYLKAVKAGEPLSTGRQLRNWFLQVTANAARDYFRSEDRRRTRERNVALDANAATNPDAVPDDDVELRRLIDAELARLDEKMRAPISLHYEQGLSYEEASTVLGVPAATLRVQASRGLEELRLRLSAARRPISAEVLIAVLAVSLNLKASPAAAAAIASIVKGASAASAGAGGAAAAATKSPLLIPAKAAGVAVIFKIAAIALAGCAALGTTAAIGYWAVSSKQTPAPVVQSTPIAAEKSADLEAVAFGNAAKVAPPKADPPNVNVAEAVKPRTATAQASIKERLDRPISFQFVDMPLAKAIAFIGTTLQVPITIDPNVLKNPPQINLRVNDTSGTSALEWVLRLAELKYQIRENDVFVWGANGVDVPKDVPQKAIVPVDAAIVEGWENVTELLPMVDPKKASVVGNWRFAGPELIGDPARFARIMVPYEVPREYDLRVDFTRPSGELHPLFGAPSIVVILSRENKNVAFTLDCFMNGYYSDFIKIPDHPDAVENPTLINGARYSCIIKVRDNSLSAYLNGTLIRTADLQRTAPQYSPDWRLPDQRCVGVGANFAQVTYHRIALRAVTGEGKPAAPEADADQVGSAEYWKESIDLFAKPMTAANIVSGNWTFANGDVSVEAHKGLPHGLLQFDFQPPEEYDYRIEFTRTQGQYDIYQILSGNNTAFAWHMGSNGLSMLDSFGNEKPKDSPVAVRTPQLNENGIRHVSIVCVRRDTIRCYVDGQLLCRLKKEDFPGLHLQNNLKLPAPKALGIGECESNITFHAARLKEVTGKAVPLALEQNNGFKGNNPGIPNPPAKPNDAVKPVKPARPANEQF